MVSGSSPRNANSYGGIHHADETVFQETPRPPIVLQVNQHGFKITDLRVATLRSVHFTSPLIRIDTNEGIYGLDEVRDGATKNYALMLKSCILGRDPYNID
ncbi:MAG: hypothetical protein EXQ58_11505 [Acidobacteria bacterium]|nr:hypothetical protein [Acidobacteriota bacterium]